MSLIKSTFVGAVILVGATVAENAQWQHPTPPQVAANPYGQAYPNGQANRYGQIYQPDANNYVPATPPPWNYNPYTNGLAPSPNRSNGS